VNYAQGCDTSCTPTTGFGSVVSMRAEKRIHGSDQQSCSPGVPPVIITGHVLAVRVPPGHASGMNAMTQICAGYEDDELELIAGFLRPRPTLAGPPRKSSMQAEPRTRTAAPGPRP
jgi:hypothetical protein